MKLATQNLGTRKSAAAGIVLLVTAVAAVLAAFIDIRYSFGVLTAPALLMLVRLMGLSRFLPRAPIGWLYAVVIFVTCWAPALGTVGTISRFALAGISIVALIHSFRLPTPRMNTAVKVGVAILLVSLISSAIGAASAAYGLSRFLNWTMFIPLLWLGVRKPDIKGAGFGLVATGIFQMIGVGLQMAGLMKGTWGGLLTSGVEYNPQTSSWLTRYTGFINNPNNLALVLTCAVIVLAACLLASMPRRTKVGLLMLMSLFTVGIVMSGSRGGLVAVAIGVIVLFAFAGKRGVALGITVVGLAIVAYSITGSKELDRLLQSFVEIVSGTDASAAQRSDIWLTRLQSTQNANVFIGTGFGGYAPDLFAGQSGLEVDTAAARLATVDNSWLKLLLESGVLGMVGMAVTMAVPMFTALTKSTGARRLWGIASGAVITAFVWRSFSVDMLDQNPWNAIVFLALGLACATTSKQPPVPKSVTEKPVRALVRATR